MRKLLLIMLLMFPVFLFSQTKAEFTETFEKADSAFNVEYETFIIENETGKAYNLDSLFKSTDRLSFLEEIQKFKNRSFRFVRRIPNRSVQSNINNDYLDKYIANKIGEYIKFEYSNPTFIGFYEWLSVQNMTKNNIIKTYKTK